MDHISGQDREQMMIMSLDQMVHKESFVRIIDAFVDALDLEEFDFLYSKLNKAGRPPFHPSTMLKLYLYGYQNGIRSCRKLEKATQINIEVLWLLKGLRPNFKTIAKFRKDNSKAFREVFRSFVSILKGWDLVDGKHIAIDSFKIRAQNSLKNNHNQRKIDRHLDYIDNKINEYFELLDDENDPAKRELINQKIEYNSFKADRYLNLSKRLEEEQVDQISTVDPDARAVLLHRNIVNVGYNVQAISDGKNKMLVGVDTGDVNDTHALVPMIRIAQTNMAVKSMSVLADKGYHTGAQLAESESLGVKTFVSPKANAANRQYNVFPMEQFVYHPGSDTYRCPNNSILRSNGQTYQRKGQNKKGTWVPFKHYKTKECMNCSIKEQCTRSPRGRIIQRSVHQGAIDRNNARVNNDPDYYRNRQQIIEHQFGTLKRQWGFTHVLMRGKENVLGEVSLMFMAYNLRRSVSILGFEELLRRLKGLFCFFWSILIVRTLMGDLMILNIISDITRHGLSGHQIRNHKFEYSR
ncbi:MAG: IS1182 family transposase [Saprospiraceae bacterium]|jgi:transposase|nr:IS1182 family transposase [Saprospiraceae bacterium]